MSESERDADCAEYVLGTLPAAERRALEAEAATDPALRATIVRWETWLAGLNDVIADVTPPPGVWAAIARRIAPAAPSADPLAHLRRSRSRWRTTALAFAALAAGLALFVASRQVLPPSASYLAVIDRGGALPALVVRVDTANRTVSVRSLAAEAPSDRVLQLWYIGGGDAPRSMGLLGAPVALPPGAGNLANATLAVSVEPPGGSTTGAPTGPVVYSGKLIRDE